MGISSSLLHSTHLFNDNLLEALFTAFFLFLSLSTPSSPLLTLLFLFGLKNGQISPFLKNKPYGALPLLLENNVITHLSFSAKEQAVHALQCDHLSSLLPKGQSPSSSMSSPCTHPHLNTLSSVLSLHFSTETILCQCCPIKIQCKPHM